MRRAGRRSVGVLLSVLAWTVRARVVSYRVSQVRAVEVLGQVCEQMPGYRAQRVPSAAALAKAAAAKAAREQARDDAGANQDGKADAGAATLEEHPCCEGAHICKGRGLNMGGVQPKPS